MKTKKLEERAQEDQKLNSELEDLKRQLGAQMEGIQAIKQMKEAPKTSQMNKR
jgi:hypothetical protein